MLSRIPLGGMGTGDVPRQPPVSIENSLPNRVDSARQVPPYARSWWFFENDTSDSDIPVDELGNVIHFANINKNIQTDFLTNDVDRLQRLSNEYGFSSIPGNFHLKEYSSKPDKQYPFVESFSQAVVSHIPQLSKDIRSYDSLFNQPGISFDTDAVWKEPLPYPLYINGDIAVHTVNDSDGAPYLENNIIALPAHEFSEQLMKDVLMKINDNIVKYFNITNAVGGGVKFEMKNISDFNLVDDVVDKIQGSRLAI